MSNGGTGENLNDLNFGDLGTGFGSGPSYGTMLSHQFQQSVGGGLNYSAETDAELGLHEEYTVEFTTSGSREAQFMIMPRTIRMPAVHKASLTAPQTFSLADEYSAAKSAVASQGEEPTEFEWIAKKLGMDFDLLKALYFRFVLESLCAAYYVNAAVYAHFSALAASKSAKGDEQFLSKHPDSSGAYTTNTLMKPSTLQATIIEEPAFFAAIMIPRTLLICAVLGAALCMPSYDEKSHKAEYEAKKYSSEGAHHDGQEYGFEKAGKEGEHGKYDKYDQAHHHASKAEEGEKKKHEEHVADKHGGKTHAKEDSHFGKDVKTKSTGYFEYKFVQPQYHMEQFHQDEKHGKKYGADSHDYGKEHYGDGKYDNKGYSKYGKYYAQDGGDHSDYAKENHGHDGHYSQYDKGQKSDNAGYYNQGHAAHGSEYDHHKEQPQYYEPHYSHYEPQHYGGGHYEPQYGGHDDHHQEHYEPHYYSPYEYGHH
ncbi:unnamed protein product, partial [Mesorhabditis spiculigera]